MQDAVDSMAKKGIGMVNTVSGVGFFKDLDITFEKYSLNRWKTGSRSVFFLSPWIRIQPSAESCLELADASNVL